jgi:drug/metabolite transporter (DMT)-like permease
VYALTTVALLLALAAAILHASWNLLLASTRDVQAATAVVLGASFVVYAPLAVLTWDVEAEVWPYAIGSAAFELAYVALLAYAYETAELSLVYPIARGVAPVIVLAAGAAVTLVEGLGVVLVATGVLLVRGLGRPDRRGLLLGLAIAACIAGYTSLDDRGIEHADPFGYLLLVLGAPSLLYLGWIWRSRGTRPLRAELGRATVAAAIASVAAYALVLLALDRADAAPVAAVRETSVVIAVALAAVFLRERVGSARLAGAAVVVAGVALLSL